jgi:hypothetical protein
VTDPDPELDDGGELGLELPAVVVPDVPTVVEAQQRVEVPTLLAAPARALLGVTAKQRTPLLADGWSWVAYRSVGLHWRTKLGDRPAGFVALEVWTVRAAGPESGGQRWRAVAAWSRHVVCLTRGARSAKTGRRPVKTAAWSSEAWMWRAGLIGSLPRACLLGDAQALVATGRPTPEQWAEISAPALELELSAWLRRELGTLHLSE